MRLRTLGGIFVANALLTACGGGGGTGGGGGVGSTPTPPPSQANSSLTNLQFSESFTNDAATGTASYSTNAPGSFSVGSQTLTVTYDASNSSYAISVPGRSQTFRLSDRQQQSDMNVVVYERKNGPTTDGLVLSRAGNDTLRYVSAGFWTRTTEGSTTISARADAFTFGVETVDNALPRIGSANYDIGLSGLVANTGTVVGLAGEGDLTADFGVGRITLSGDSFELDDGGNRIFNRPFSGIAQIASNTNGFAGVLTFDDRFGALSGNVSGRFYGPQADEIGAAFHASRSGTGTGDEMALVGTIIGRQSNSSSSGVLYNRAAHLSYGRSQITGAIVNPVSSENNISIIYEPGEDRWKLASGKGQTTTVVTSQSQTDIVPGNPNITRYQYNGDTPSTTTFDIYNGTPHNGVVLSYSGYGLWSILYYQFNRDPIDVFPFVYGSLSPLPAVPKSGTANYSGLVYGAGVGTTPSHERYELNGDATAAFDFSAASFSGNISAVATKIDDASGARSTINMGNFGLNGSISSSRPEFSGNITGSGANIGNMIGNFFGPNADEIGATIQFDAGTAQNLANPALFVGTLSAAKQ